MLCIKLVVFCVLRCDVTCMFYISGVIYIILPLVELLPQWRRGRVFAITLVALCVILISCIIYYNSGVMYYISLRTIALRIFFMTDRNATVPPLVKTVYFLRRKSCTRFGLNFSTF